MVHVVERGDTLSKLANQYYGVMRLFEAIYEANPSLSSPDELEIGQELEIPDVEEPIHVVSDGETLGTIAKFWFGDAGRYQEIADRNELDDPDLIEVGQELAIPLTSEGAC
jgi:nucleoid-associated protein YgaU